MQAASFVCEGAKDGALLPETMQRILVRGANHRGASPPDGLQKGSPPSPRAASCMLAPAPGPHLTCPRQAQAGQVVGAAVWPRGGFVTNLPRMGLWLPWCVCVLGGGWVQVLFESESEYQRIQVCQQKVRGEAPTDSARGGASIFAYECLAPAPCTLHPKYIQPKPKTVIPNPKPYRASLRVNA